jgi:hypothetical protein
MRGTLKHPVTLKPWPQLGAASCGPVTFPAGAQVHTVKDGMGRDQWAITSARLVAEITGDAHDATHRYVWIPAEAVEPA